MCSNGKVDSHCVSQHETAIKECIQKVLSMYQRDELVVSFNGGKDCSLLLHLVHLVWVERYPDERLPAFFIRDGEQFEELEAFVRESVNRYNLDLLTIDSDSHKFAVSELLRLRPAVKCVLMGTRRSDPRCEHLTTFSPTDAGWPSVMRVLPLLDCSYSATWALILRNAVPVCSLYEQGYSSLGAKRRTLRNPLLTMRNECNETIGYHPAWFLSDESHERDGRS